MGRAIISVVVGYVSGVACGPCLLAATHTAAVQRSAKIIATPAMAATIPTAGLSTMVCGR